MNESYSNKDGSKEWVQRDTGEVPIRSVTTNTVDQTMVENWEQLRLF